MKKRQHPSLAAAPASATAVRVPVSDYPSFLEDWVVDGDVRQHSSRTQDSRRERVGKLILFLKLRGVTECGLPQMRLFFQHLNLGHKEPGGRWNNPKLTKPVKSGTVKSYYSTIRAFFNWLVTQEYLPLSPMDKIEPPIDRPDQIKPHSDEQMQQMLDAAKQTLNPLRDYALLLLMIDSGIRASELCNLKREDVDLQRRTVKIQGKGNKVRHVPFSSETKASLYKYLSAEPAEAGYALFLSDRGTHAGAALTRHGLRFLVQRIAKKAGVEDVRNSPHTLRHYHAIAAIRRKADPFWVKTMLGHETLTMTN